MNNKIKKTLSTFLAALSVFSSGAIGSGLTASANEANACAAYFRFETQDKAAIPDVSFSLCEDKNKDGKFTRGIDDVSVYKSASDQYGYVFFKGLRPDKTYFITQNPTNSCLYDDKNVYSFKLRKSDVGKTVNLLDYLPNDVYMASYKVNAYLQYKFEFESEDTGGIPDATFAICEDVNGDGVFTRGIDDKAVYKRTSDNKGLVMFVNLSSNKTYFITQMSSGYSVVPCDKNVYPLYFGLNEKNFDKYDGYVNILDYLPTSTYTAKVAVDSHLILKTADENPVKGTTFAICEDRDNDGVFTHGIDDLSVMKRTTDSSGFLSFDKLTSGKRYFITQLSSDSHFVCNKNIYSVVIPTYKTLVEDNLFSEYNSILLNDYLPRSAVTTKLK